jgi:hypothetical protein
LLPGLGEAELPVRQNRERGHNLLKRGGLLALGRAVAAPDAIFYPVFPEEIGNQAEPMPGIL